MTARPSATLRRLASFKTGTGVYARVLSAPEPKSSRRPARAATRPRPPRQVPHPPSPQLLSRRSRAAIVEAESRGESLLVVAKDCREYDCWRNAIGRCHDPKHPQFSDYGGRGIQVCDAWRHPLIGFYRFLGHVGLKPDASLTIDRIENDRGYEPGNVRWTDTSTQSQNRRPRRDRLPPPPAYCDHSRAARDRSTRRVVCPCGLSWSGGNAMTERPDAIEGAGR